MWGRLDRVVDDHAALLKQSDLLLVRSSDLRKRASGRPGFIAFPPDVYIERPFSVHLSSDLHRKWSTALLRTTDGIRGSPRPPRWPL
jgi:hypothetical protein